MVYMFDISNLLFIRTLSLKYKKFTTNRLGSDQNLSKYEGIINFIIKNEKQRILFCDTINSWFAVKMQKMQKNLTMKLLGTT